MVVPLDGFGMPGARLRKLPCPLQLKLKALPACIAGQYMTLNHPHILRITTDQHSPKVAGFAGDPYVRTPNLDRLAARGTVLANHYGANPVCCPGRNSIMTGRLPRELGTPCFMDELPSKSLTYPEHLARYGYQTTCVGKMHFHGKDQMHGWLFRPYGDMEILGRSHMQDYDATADLYKDAQWKVKYEDFGGYTPFMLKTARPGTDKYILFDQSVTREACLHLRDYFSTLIAEPYQGERPLLFEASFKTPHCPFICPPDLFEYYMDVLPLPAKIAAGNVPQQILNRQQSDQPRDITEDHIRRARAGYWGLVQWVDEQIGLVLNALEQTGHADEFLILYTSDHGEMAGERGLWQKTCFYEESVRVPTIVAGAGIEAGRSINANTSHLDILPTMAGLAGLPVPESAYGVDLSPVLRGRSALDQNRIIFSEYFEGGQKNDPIGTQVNGVMAKKGQLKWIDYCDGDSELFDLSNDAAESHNLSGSPNYASVQSELEEAIRSLPEPWRVHRPGWRMTQRPRNY